MVAPAAISADAGIPVVASQQAGAEPVQSRGLGSLTSRILSGSVLGLAGGSSSWLEDGSSLLPPAWWLTRPHRSSMASSRLR